MIGRAEPEFNVLPCHIMMMSKVALSQIAIKVIDLKEFFNLCSLIA
jgi:hypothetical protein